MRPRSVSVAAAGAFAWILICAAPACSRASREDAKAAPQTQAGKPASAGQPAKVNLEEIFPPGRGRDLVLNNCTTCHTFVPIVVLQMSKDGWQRNSRDHRERVKALSEGDFKILYEYLMANFNESKPAPRLPEELLQTWTGY
ncbi:MAG: hypothetical protein HY235_26590 [Acidobacteria bacterium]|nr:hypothetical protein [Acidobacteriota bacterium]